MDDDRYDLREQFKRDNPVAFLRYSPLTKLMDRLYLGGYCDLEDVARLRALGITAICNLTELDFGMERDGFKTLVLEQPDRFMVPDAKIATFLRWMDERWADGDTVLVHCQAGISRTSSFVAAWLMHQKGCHAGMALPIEWRRAVDEIGAVRGCIEPHPQLRLSIIKYFEQRSKAS